MVTWYDLIRSFKVRKKLKLKEEKLFWEKLKKLILLGEGNIDKFTDSQIKFE